METQMEFKDSASRSLFKVRLEVNKFSEGNPRYYQVRWMSFREVVARLQSGHHQLMTLILIRIIFLYSKRLFPP